MTEPLSLILTAIEICREDRASAQPLWRLPEIVHKSISKEPEPFIFAPVLLSGYYINNILYTQAYWPEAAV